MIILEPNPLAATFRQQLREEISDNKRPLTVVGFLASDDPASETYATYTKDGCNDVGIAFRLIKTTPDQLLEQIQAANQDPGINGIFIYYPVYKDSRDDTYKEAVSPYKDVEGLTSYWMNKLYADQRFDNAARAKKCVLPCTPLAIIKLLEQTDAYAPYGLPFRDQTITIFNRSEVVGRPLAYMLSNDGAKVHSFDLNGGVTIAKNCQTTPSITREQALRESNIIITGVPSRQFPKIAATEIKPDVIGLNFSYVPNYEPDAKEACRIYIPRVGTLTVAMCLRNALRLSTYS